MFSVHKQQPEITCADLLTQDGDAFLHFAYRSILNRVPDPEGLKYYAARLAGGIEKIEILGQLRQSKEGIDQAAVVNGLDAMIREYKRFNQPLMRALVSVGIVRHPKKSRLGGAQGWSARDRSKLRQISSDLARYAEQLTAQAEALTKVHDDFDGTLTGLSGITALVPDGFDSAWYLAQYPDVVACGMDAFQHYDQYGWKEYRNPSVIFDTRYYLETYLDVKQSGVNPFLHWVRHGRLENRAVNGYESRQSPDTKFAPITPGDSMPRSEPGRSLFDQTWYLTQYPDVAEGNVDAWEHYCEAGWREGRNPNATFNTTYYLASNLDVAHAQMNPLIHWDMFGKGERRKTSLVNVSARPRTNKVATPSIIFVSHEASRTGAPAVLLSLMQWIKKNTQIKFSVVIGAGGPWNDRFEALADCFYLDRNYARALRDELREFCGNHVKVIYVNTIASGFYAEHLKFLNAKFVTHVHEMESVFNIFEPQFAALKPICDKYIAVSKASVEALSGRINTEGVEIVELPPFIEPVKNTGVTVELIKDRKIIFGCGAVELRKGFDIFCQVGVELLKVGYTNFKMYWIGATNSHLDPIAEIERAGLRDHVEWLGVKNYPRDYFRHGHLFLLPSREDPYPLVCMEAAECHLPVICFDERAGGMHTFVENDAGVVVPFEDAVAMASAARKLLTNNTLREKLGQSASDKAKRRHYVDAVAPQILKELPALPTVTAASELDSYTAAMAEAEVVSFDIFDTLVTRRVNDPAVVFDVVEYELTRNESALIPLIDERMATAGRVLSSRNGKVDDISIDDIYKEMSFYRDPTAEKEVEIKMCVPNPLGLQIYQSAVKLGKKIFIASDMYLDQKTIERILRKCGVDKWDQLFVSSALGRKKDTGRMYATLLETAAKDGIGARSILHIGDNWTGDILRAQESNIPAIRFVPLYDKQHRLFPLTVERRKTLSQKGRIWDAFCGQTVNLWGEKQPGVAQDFFTKLGFEISGPLAAMMAMHVRKQAQETGARRIVFMARDGRIIKKAFDRFYRDDIAAGIFVSSYLSLSRATVVPATFSHPLTSNDFYFIIEGLHLAQKPLKYFIEKAGLSLSHKGILKCIRKYFKSEDVIPDWDSMNVLSRLFNELSADIFKANKKNRGALELYLSQNGFASEDKIIVVDVGWMLNIQSRLAKFAKSVGFGAKIHGCYIGSHDRIDKSISHASLLFEGGDPELYAKPIADNTTLFELLFSAPEVSATGLRLAGNGKDVQVTYRTFAGQPDSEFLAAQKIHSGAEQFFDYMADALHDFFPESVSKDFFAALFDALVETENPLAKAVLGEFEVKLGGHHDLTSPQALLRNDSFVEYKLATEDEYFAPIVEGETHDKQVVLVTSAGLNNGSTRYRAVNLMRSLSSCGIGATLIHASTSVELAEPLIHRADTTVFQRCFEDQGNVGALYKLARKHKVTCVGEIDDLIFPEHVETIGSVAGGEWDIQHATFIAESYQAFLRKMDGAIVSTPVLRRHVSLTFSFPVAICRNKIEARFFKPKFGVGVPIRLLYASGTYSHKEDFLLIAETLTEFLKTNPGFTLSILGAAQVPADLLVLPNVFSYGILSYDDMLDFISGHDLMLVPLEDTIFNEAKSYVKYIESAAVGVPLMASAIGEFDFAISHKVNGLLAKTQEDWKTLLNEIVGDPGLLEKLGRNAYLAARESFCADRMESDVLDVLFNDYSVSPQRLEVI
ncbi:glycosyltransferase [Paraburkholderia sediminicola]|uniref:glycosyltransferase n=1 Tax=Paraburkholderia sediminicola TaxID=458836 RepID=UPI0038BBF37B